MSTTSRSATRPNSNGTNGTNGSGPTGPPTPPSSTRQRSTRSRNAAPDGATAPTGPSSDRPQIRTPHPYALRSLLVHHQQGTWNHGHAHYRCRYPQEYAIANLIDHPLSVYLREDAILPDLDAWLATAFAPHHLEATQDALATQQPTQTSAATDPNRRKIAACDRKLAQHRAALEAGADSALVTGWINETQAERAEAVAALAQAGDRRQTAPPRLTRQEIKNIVGALGGIATVLRTADATDKAEIYQQLGLRLSYDHETRIVSAEASPRPSVGLVAVSEGGLEPPRPIKGTSTSS